MGKKLLSATCVAVGLSLALTGTALAQASLTPHEKGIGFVVAALFFGFLFIALYKTFGKWLPIIVIGAVFVTFAGPITIYAAFIVFIIFIYALIKR